MQSVVNISSNSQTQPHSKFQSAQTLAYIPDGFAEHWGGVQLKDIYPQLKTNTQPLATDDIQQDMQASCQSRYLEAYNGLFTAIGDESCEIFLALLSESLINAVNFLFTSLPSLEQKNLQLPTASGMKSIPMPTHYQEPPIRTLLKEMRNFQFYALLGKLRQLLSQFEVPVVIPETIETPTLTEEDLPKNCFSLHTDENGFCYIGYFDHRGLLASRTGEHATVINTQNNESTLVAPFKNGLAEGPGVYRDPNTHTLRSQFTEGVANGDALYITKLWEHVLIGEVVNGAFQNYQTIAQLPENTRAHTNEQTVTQAGEVACELGDYVDGSVQLKDAVRLASMKLLPKEYQQIKLNANGDLVTPRQVLQTSSGVILGTRQSCASRTTEFELKGHRFYPHFWAVPTLVSARLPRAPAELSEKKKAGA